MHGAQGDGEKRKSVFGISLGKNADFKLKLEFEMKEKMADMYETQELQRTLRTRILGVTEDAEMSDKEIRSVKEALLNYMHEF